MSNSELGGGIKVSDAGSLNFSLLLMSSAARHLVAFCLGHIPKMASSIEGYNVRKFAAVCKMVFAMSSDSLALPCKCYSSRKKL